MLRTVLLMLLLGAPAAGYMAGTRPSLPGGDDGEPAVRRVTGRLTDEGVECPALRSDEGRLYTLVGDLKGFKPGDRVIVEGTVAEVSFCMQGTTLQVRSIRAA